VLDHAWPDQIYFLHIFDHPLYDLRDQVEKPFLIDADGGLRDYRRGR
jgi:hypothetical protein